MAVGKTRAARKRKAPLRRLLLASDLTAYSDRAFDRAAMLAREHGAALQVLHVFDANILPERYVLTDVKDVRALLEKEVRDSGIGRRIDVSVNVVVGQTARAITEAASKTDADLIVMGLSHMVLTGPFRGTTVDQVVRSAHRPVLTVKTRPRRSYKKIAVCVDMNEPSRRALDFALRAFGTAQCHVIHIHESRSKTQVASARERAILDEQRHALEDMVRIGRAAAGRVGGKPPGTPKLIMKTGKPVQAIQEEIERLDPELVVLGTHGRTGMPKLFLGSVAETLLEALPCDVLNVRA